eukprot:m.38484 g.38484  ORF g.38484 m.38484 type:complete len:309 (+) comp9442_c0_seq1:999-1925(+)
MVRFAYLLRIWVFFVLLLFLLLCFIVISYMAKCYGNKWFGDEPGKQFYLTRKIRNLHHFLFRPLVVEIQKDDGEQSKEVRRRGPVGGNTIGFIRRIRTRHKGDQYSRKKHRDETAERILCLIEAVKFTALFMFISSPDMLYNMSCETPILLYKSGELFEDFFFYTGRAYLEDTMETVKAFRASLNASQLEEFDAYFELGLPWRDAIVSTVVVMEFAAAFYFIIWAEMLFEWSLRHAIFFYFNSFLWNWTIPFSHLVFGNGHVCSTSISFAGGCFSLFNMLIAFLLVLASVEQDIIRRVKPTLEKDFEF